MTSQTQSGDLTRTVMSRYFESEHTDVSDMAYDMVFTVRATGDEHRGSGGVRGMLDYF